MTETITVTRNRTVKVFVDPHPTSPREWDNLGTMACWHRRYDLGDVRPVERPSGYLLTLLSEADPRAAEVLSQAYNRGRDVDDLIRTHTERHHVILPLYLYDHSGLTMNTTGFSCPWDSGQVGIIHCSLKRAREEFHFSDADPTDDEVRARVVEHLTSEVAEYDAYLRGDIYGFEVVDELIDEDGDVLTTEYVDGCSGFLDVDGYPALDAMREHVDPPLHAALEAAMSEPEHH